MISLFSGTPGSGKSLHLATYIFERCKREKTTIGNFPINPESVQNSEFYHYWDNKDITVRNLINFSKDYFETERFREGRLLLIIDEAQLLFNAREWNIKGRSDWILFFTQHRKLGYDIILVAQFDKMLDKQIRSLLEYEYIHRKVSNFGWKGKLLSIWSGNKLFVSVKIWYPLNERVGSEYFHFHKKYSNLYDTNALFDSLDQVLGVNDVVSNEDNKENDVSNSDILSVEVINYEL